jgi:hypothetical protein
VLRTSGAPRLHQDNADWLRSMRLQMGA